MEKLGLVLSGGGAKGSYEIGVYKALKRLGKIPDIVTGTSVGAINGVMIVQKELRKTIKLWKNMSFKAIYDENSFNICDNPKIATVYAKYAKAFITEGGMDVTKLSKIFDHYYNPKKFFKSEIDYGLITYNLTQNKPVIITKDKMTPENVKDYVIASASCYPAFKPYKINDESYIDGGYYDNLPINLAIDMGATNIIAVDLRAVGFKVSPKKDIPIITISPRNKITSFLVFDKLKSREALHFGYNDTMKTFRMLDGHLFTFRKTHFIKNYNKYADKFEENLHDITRGTAANIIKKIAPLEQLLKHKVSYNYFNNLVEKSGKCFELPEDNIYNIKVYNKALLKALTETEALSKDLILTKIKTKDIKTTLERKQIVKYFYEEIKNKRISGIYRLLPLVSDEFLIALYIYTIKGNKTAY